MTVVPDRPTTVCGCPSISTRLPSSAPACSPAAEAQPHQPALHHPPRHSKDHRRAISEHRSDQCLRSNETTRRMPQIK